MRKFQQLLCRSKITFTLIAATILSSTSVLAAQVTFTQKIENNVPYMMEAGLASGVITKGSMQTPPSSILTNGQFNITSDSSGAILGENFVLYYDAETGPSYGNGCKIVSLSEDAFGGVTETVAPAIEQSIQPGSQKIFCSCDARGGTTNPYAIMHLFLDGSKKLFLSHPLNQNGSYTCNSQCTGKKCS